MPVINHKKVEVDIDQIDIDILEINGKIEALAKEKDFLANMRKYALAKHLNGSSVANGNLAKTKRKTKRKAKPKTKSKATTGISNFILNFLKSGQTETKNLIEGWAKVTGKDYGKVANSISNALNRLKQDQKIDGVIDPRGKRYGASWFLKKEKAANAASK